MFLFLKLEYMIRLYTSMCKCQIMFTLIYMCIHVYNQYGSRPLHDAV